MADITSEELEKLERECHSSTGGIKSIKIGTKNNLSGAVQIDGANAKDIASKVYDFALSSFADGEYKIYLQAEDVAGNKTDVIEATSAFIVDSTNPTVKITSPVSNSVVNKAVTFVGTVQNQFWNIQQMEQVGQQLQEQLLH